MADQLIKIQGDFYNYKRCFFQIIWINLNGFPFLLFCMFICFITICLTTIWKWCLVNGHYLKVNNGHPIFGHFQLILQSFCPNSGDLFAFNGLNLFEGLWTVCINIVFQIFLQKSVWWRQNREEVFWDQSTNFFFFW